MIVGDKEKILNFRQSGATFLSGHELSTWEYTCQRKSTEKTTYTKRDFKHFNVTNFLIALDNTFRHENSVSLGSHEIAICGMYLNIINNSLLQSLNIHAPYRTLTSKRPHAPWLTIAIKQQIKVHERLRNTLRRNHTITNRQLFNAQRNKVQDMLIQSRHDYNMSQLANCSNPHDHCILLKRTRYD